MVKERVMTIRSIGYSVRTDKVEVVVAKDMGEVLKKKREKLTKDGKASQYKGFGKPIRICLKLGRYQSLPQPLVYGIDRNTAIGIAMTRKEFKSLVLR